MKYIITKYIAIAILLSISILAVSAQEQTATSTLVTTDANTSAAKKLQSNSTDDWSGFYVGGFGGYTRGTANPITSTPYAPGGYFSSVSIPAVNIAGNQKFKSNKLSGGGTVGYNFQKGYFFVGGETDFGVNRVNESVTTIGAYPTGAGKFTITQTVKSDWMLTVRPRGGIALKKVLLYVTGGLAVTNLKYDETFTDIFDSATQSASFKKMKTGWTAGAGVEVKIAGHWSVKGDYLFTQFGRISTTSNNLKGSVIVKAPLQVFTHSTDLKLHNIRFGINYRF
jgi:outer membrane immunogenic protein